MPTMRASVGRTLNTLAHRAEFMMLDGQPAICFYLRDGTAVWIDEADLELLTHRWEPHQSRSAVYVMGRATKNGHTARFRLHRVILERMLGRPLKPGMEVDHINRNPLDNRRCNLREVTRSENERNKKRSRPIPL